MMNDIIVGIGEVLWDVFPEGKRIGGAPANFAYHMLQFGFDSRVVSAVGEDVLGNEILENFNGKGLRYWVERVSFPTGIVEVTLDGEGIPCYEIKQGVAWDNVPYTPELDRLACQTRCVCFGSLAQRNVVTRTTLNRFLEAMSGEAYKVFDINLRQHFYTVEVLKDSLARCNILKLNDEELVILSDLLELSEESVEKRCREMMDRFDLDVLILTCGVQGSYVFAGDIHSFLDTPHVKVADTVGAGDSFTAIIQTKINPSILGRVFSIYMSLNMLPAMFGLMSTGFLADHVGITNTFVIGGFVVLAIGVVSFCIPSLLQVGKLTIGKNTRNI